MYCHFLSLRRFRLKHEETYGRSDYQWMSHPEIKPNLSPQPPLISPLYHFPERPKWSPSLKNTFSPSLYMKTKLGKTKYKLHCVNEKYNGVKWALPISENSKEQPKGNPWKWISLTLNDWMHDKISTWGKCEHCCLRSFAFNKMLSKEIEY